MVNDNRVVAFIKRRIRRHCSNSRTERTVYVQPAAGDGGSYSDTSAHGSGVYATDASQHHTIASLYPGQMANNSSIIEVTHTNIGARSDGSISGSGRVAEESVDADSGI